MNNKQILRTVIPLAITGVVLFILAIGLTGEPFAPAIQNRPAVPAGPGFLPRSPGYLQNLGWLVVVYLVLLALAVGGTLSTTQGRWRAIALVVLTTIFFLLIKGINQQERTTLLEIPESQPTLPVQEVEPATTPIFVEQTAVEPMPTHAPTWVVTLITTVLGLLGVGMILLLVMMINRIRRPGLHARLADEASQALRAIEAGGDLGDVVTRCYSQMNQALLEDRGVSREQSMTVEEFERVLSSMGFPEKPIHTLTALFELVRYGHISPGEEMAHHATESLQAILHYTKSTAVSK